jgi:hypothetical protein
MWFFDDIADWWDEKKRETEAILEEWVEDDPSWFAVAVAGTVQTAMDIGGGTVDTLRLGEGIKEGGWRGVGEDALRLIGLAGPIAKGARGISAFYTRNPCGSICGWVSASKALRHTGVQHFSTVDDLARASGQVPGGIADVADLIPVLQVSGATARVVQVPVAQGFLRILQSIGARARAMRPPQTMDEVVKLIKSNPDGVVIFGISWFHTKQGKQVGHALYGFRDFLGRIRFADRGLRNGRHGVIASSLDDLERQVPGYAGIRNAKPYANAVMVDNATVVKVQSGAAVVALEVRAVVLANREEARKKMKEIQTRRRTGAPRRKAKSTGGGSSKGSTASKAGSSPAIHIVKAGETWRSIAQHYYGDGDKGSGLELYNTMKGYVPANKPLEAGMRIAIQ